MCATLRSASRSSASPGWLISRVACPRCASRHRGQLPPHAQLDLTPGGRGCDVRPGGDTLLLFVFERALRWTASNITNPAPGGNQNSNVTLNRGNRGFSTVVGNSHVAPLVTGSYVWL